MSFTARVRGLTSNSATAENPLGVWASTYDTTYGYRIFKYTKSAESSTALIAGGASVQKVQAAVGSNYEILQPATGYLNLYAGVLMAARTAGYYGWNQILGWYDGAYVLGHGSATAAGVSWKPTNGQNYLVYDGAADATPGFPRHAVACEAYTTTTASAAKDVYVKALW